MGALEHFGCNILTNTLLYTLPHQKTRYIAKDEGANIYRHEFVSPTDTNLDTLYTSTVERLLIVVETNTSQNVQLIWAQLTMDTQIRHLLLYLLYLHHHPSHQLDPCCHLPSTDPRPWAPQKVSVPPVLSPLPLRCFGRDYLRQSFGRFLLPSIQ